MKTNIFKIMVPAAAFLLSGALSSCVADLDFESASDTNDPRINQPFDANLMYTKCYASLIMEGNDGAADFDIDDGGKSCLLRNIYNLECLGTEESICWWTDGGLINVCYNQSAAGDQVLKFMYYRLMSNITYCNHFLNDEKCRQLGSTKHAEVRWIRAFNYYFLANEFGNVPFLTKISGEAAPRATQAEMYQWLINEFTECEKDLMEAGPKTDSDKEKYGRVDKAAAWLMLSRLYLNAQVWNAKVEGFDYNAALEQSKRYAKKVMESGYDLSNETTTVTDQQAGVQCTYTGYDKLFMADNGSSSAHVEAILPLLQDAEKTRGWGGTLFFMAAHSSADIETVTGLDRGNTEGWRGMRVRRQLLEKFTNSPEAWEGKTSKEIRQVAGDDRALFWAKGHTVQIAHNDKDESFDQGVIITKFSNRRSDGKMYSTTGVDGDFFLLRTAEAYLNYAEAEARLSGGTLAAGSEGAKCMDKIRQRAHCAKTISTYSLNDILDERAREFYCEGYRRTDLIRFGQYGGNEATYTWDWKGGVAGGQAFPATGNLYPIPSSELLANPNLQQNEGYN